MTDVFTPVFNTLKHSQFPHVYAYAVHLPSFAHMWGYCLAAKETSEPSSYVSLYAITVRVFGAQQGYCKSPDLLEPPPSMYRIACVLCAWANLNNICRAR
jgi:hypothetical protein